MPLEDGNKEQILKSCLTQVRRYIREDQTYIRPCLIEQMCQGELLGLEESEIFRAFFKRFVNVELRMIVSMIRKLRKKEKVTYFKLGRKFLKSFLARK